MTKSKFCLACPVEKILSLIVLGGFLQTAATPLAKNPYLSFYSLYLWILLMIFGIWYKNSRKYLDYVLTSVFCYWLIFTNIIWTFGLEGDVKSFPTAIIFIFFAFSTSLSYFTISILILSAFLIRVFFLGYLADLFLVPFIDGIFFTLQGILIYICLYFTASLIVKLSIKPRENLSFVPLLNVVEEHVFKLFPFPRPLSSEEKLAIILHLPHEPETKDLMLRLFNGESLTYENDRISLSRILMEKEKLPYRVREGATASRSLEDQPGKNMLQRRSSLSTESSNILNGYSVLYGAPDHHLSEVLDPPTFVERIFSKNVVPQIFLRHIVETFSNTQAVPLRNFQSLLNFSFFKRLNDTLGAVRYIIDRAASLPEYQMPRRNAFNGTFLDSRVERWYCGWKNNFALKYNFLTSKIILYLFVIQGVYTLTITGGYILETRSGSFRLWLIYFGIKFPIGILCGVSYRWLMSKLTSQHLFGKERELTIRNVNFLNFSALIIYLLVAISDLIISLTLEFSGVWKFSQSVGIFHFAVAPIFGIRTAYSSQFVGFFYGVIWVVCTLYATRSSLLVFSYILPSIAFNIIITRILDSLLRRVFCEFGLPYLLFLDGLLLDLALYEDVAADHAILEVSVMPDLYA
eukprot:GHVP01025739.1.p1 GENE.GHVP01025739.1~~GHVP01025739.1.p1  ORF type:complete len:633 (-),score=61.18 GHVP01025739.1:282-2180(-)